MHPVLEIAGDIERTQRQIGPARPAAGHRLGMAATDAAAHHQIGGPVIWAASCAAATIGQPMQTRTSVNQEIRIGRLPNPVTNRAHLYSRLVRLIRRDLAEGVVDAVYEAFAGWNPWGTQ